MKIVIDIPEYMYNDIKYREYVYPEHAEDLALYIIDGTPLPKGHGRLIDADKLKPRDISPEAWYSPMWGFELVDIEDAPTIIDAESEDKK